MQKAKAKRTAKSDAIGGFILKFLVQNESLTEFDDVIWLTVIDKVAAHEDGRLVFKFYNGAEDRRVKVKIP